jgi:putative cardiolipin synthase
MFRYLEFVFNISRLNQRMHNKLIVVDRQAAIIGGRNIADEYFETHENNFYRDLDVFAYGEVAEEITNAFNEYWTSNASVDAKVLMNGKLSQKKTQKLYKKIRAKVDGYNKYPYAVNLSRSRSEEVISGLIDDIVIADYEIVYDSPSRDSNGMLSTARKVKKLQEQATHEILISTPYLIPDYKVFERIAALTGNGVEIRYLTNSLASIDVVIAYVGYAGHIKGILEKGAKIYEYKPHNKRPIRKNGSLHVKAAVIDREIVFMGSYNFDQRSTYLNKDIGIVIMSNKLANQVANLINELMGTEHSWERLFDRQCLKRNDLSECKVLWYSLDKGMETVKRNEPKTGLWKSIKLLFLSVLPVSDKHL